MSAPPRRVEQALADAIVRRAHEFTLPALLDALQAAGLRAQEIIFRSHRSSGHQAFLVQAIEFQSEPQRAVVTLNIGLLAAQSPLPSYFFSAMDDGGHDTDAILAVLALVDHPLLRERARAEYPERDQSSVSDWQQAKGLVLRLLALPSPSSLHWLFQRVFPELALQVERTVEGHGFITDQVILGATALGESRALGGAVRLATSAVAVTLYCEEPLTLTGRPWTQEAATRVDRYILTLLREQPLFLHVYLVFRERDAAAHLVSDLHAPDSFLGYDPLGKSAPPPVQSVLLFSGYTDRRES